jgi:Flp pilus assembly protein TadG
MTGAILLARCAVNRVRRLAGDDRGVSAVEFAMLLPLMLTLYLGTVEISQGISTDRKVTLTARTVADLVSQVSSIDTTGMQNLFAAASAVITPYSSANLTVTLSSISIDANSKATIAWSCALNTTARAKGSSVTLPSTLVIPSSSLIWSEASYA